eukprot:CAMPEP_0194101148 /NCGR_PEP_ID=MMETSP0150-20130528/1850_1 /TAXON_ID=122233 /ORGANISM="Chaetoceros debilis, Strain MM31A-1" /LENGTH=513 /DNA_ID=CAMNT_0038787655 /DNA_START=153 /DNA_END=1694 /DNA_ORIENTATION=-
MLSSHLHKKGLFTVCLIILTETITLSNAVQFWSTYQNWSNRYGRGRFQERQQQQEEDSPRGGYFAKKFGSSQFSKSATAFQECSKSAVATGTGSGTGTGGININFGNSKSSKSNNNNNSNCKNPISSTGAGAGAPSTIATLHPRKLSRIASAASRTKNARTCSKEMYDCCKNHTPQCIALDIRGGHGHSHVLQQSIPDIEGAASAAAQTISSAMPTPYNIPLNMWKVIFQIFLTAMNVACWLIPLRAKKITENKYALGIANAFSGGVFLSLAFGHLIPECIHGFEGTGLNEALPYMIVLGGYLLIFFVEKVAFDAHGLMHDCGPGDGSGDEHGKEVVVKKDGKEVVVKEDGGDTATATATANNGRSAVILLGALAVHSILEMTALGLARTFGDSALLSLSIALHQPAESIALLVAFLKSGMPKSDIIKYLSVFSAMGPVGVAIGMAVTSFAAPIVDSIMLATVAGTFIYVGATEVIPEEWEDQEHKWPKFFALMCGIISIFGITQYTMTLEGH